MLKAASQTNLTLKHLSARQRTIQRTRSPSLPASPTIPVRDSSTRLSAIQTVQTYITHEAQAIQSHLTAVLPGLIQGEVRTQLAQLAQEIGAQISSIREEVIRSTGDQDYPMSSSNKESENQDSREHGKRCSGRSHNKRKGKAWWFAQCCFLRGY